MDKRSLLITSLCYLIVLVYGTLYPFQNWQVLSQSANSVLQWPRYFSRSDSFTNLIIYLPLGFFVATLVCRRYSLFIAIIVSTTLGGSLSFVLEYIQSFIPTRVSSLADVALNAVGAFCGALIAMAVLSEKFRNKQLSNLVNRYFFYSEKSGIVLVIIILWLLAELMPFVPSISRADMLYGIRPFWFALSQAGHIDLAILINYFLIVIVLGVLVSNCLREKDYLVRWMGVLVIFVITAKIIVVTRQIYLEAMLGMFIGLFVANWLSKTRLANNLVIVMSAALLIIFIGAFQINQPSVNAINWMPFHFQIQSAGFRLSSLIQQMWPYTVLSYALYCAGDAVYANDKILKSGLFVLFIALGIECIHQTLPGQYLDITNIILAMAGWLFVHILILNLNNNSKLYSEKI